MGDVAVDDDGGGKELSNRDLDFSIIIKEFELWKIGHPKQNYLWLVAASENSEMPDLADAGDYRARIPQRGISVGGHN